MSHCEAVLDCIRKADIVLACAELPCECEEGGSCYCMEYPAWQQVRLAREILSEFLPTQEGNVWQGPFDNSYKDGELGDPLG